LDSYNIFKKAQSERYAIGSFNFSTAEILKAIVQAAEKMKSPVIVSTSEGEAKFVEMCEAAALVEAWRKEKSLPIILNLDHGKSLESIREALAAGYDAVHFDGSELSFEENIKKTKEAVEYVRGIEKVLGKGIIIEGEIGYLRGSSSLHKEKLEITEADLTTADQATRFLAETGVNSLAVVIGNAHGVFAAGEEKLNLERLAEIRQAVEERVFLVLHGGSGIPEEDVKKAIELGIVKVNVNTELRLAYKNALDKQLKENPEESTPYKILGPSLAAVEKVVMEKIKLFGSGNKI
jgi:fructose-bisphosphate aldolase class II